jgi:hypothetical protein
MKVQEIELNDFEQSIIFSPKPNPRKPFSLPTSEEVFSSKDFYENSKNRKRQDIMNKSLVKRTDEIVPSVPPITIRPEYKKEIQENRSRSRSHSIKAISKSPTFRKAKLFYFKQKRNIYPPHIN